MENFDLWSIEWSRESETEDVDSLNSRIDMWGSFIVHVSFLWEILFRKCGEGKYMGSFLSYWVELGIYINVEVGMGM